MTSGQAIGQDKLKKIYSDYSENFSSDKVLLPLENQSNKENPSPTDDHKQRVWVEQEVLN
jgi:type IV secretory pathway component VirB8